MKSIILSALFLTGLIAGVQAQVAAVQSESATHTTDNSLISKEDEKKMQAVTNQILNGYAVGKADFDWAKAKIAELLQPEAQRRAYARIKAETVANAKKYHEELLAWAERLKNDKEEPEDPKEMDEIVKKYDPRPQEIAAASEATFERRKQQFLTFQRLLESAKVKN